MEVPSEGTSRSLKASGDWDKRLATGNSSRADQAPALRTPDALPHGFVLSWNVCRGKDLRKAQHLGPTLRAFTGVHTKRRALVRAPEPVELPCLRFMKRHTATIVNRAEDLAAAAQRLHSRYISPPKSHFPHEQMDSAVDTGGSLLSRAAESGWVPDLGRHEPARTPLRIARSYSLTQRRYTRCVIRRARFDSISKNGHGLLLQDICRDACDPRQCLYKIKARWARHPL